MVVPKFSNSQAIHLWWLTPNHPIDVRVGLTAEDLAKAETLSNLVRREEFLRSRSFLRQLVQLYGLDSKTPILAADQNRKPRFKNDLIQYNLSHSEGYTVVALSPSAEIGVDIEDSSRTITNQSLVLQRITGQEGQMMLADEFFNLWTAKEAALKLVGGGFQSEAKSVLVYGNRFTYHGRSGTLYRSRCLPITLALAHWDDQALMQIEVSVWKL